MLNCPNCGYEIQEDTKFCSACGSPVKVVKNQEDIYQSDFVRQRGQFSKDPFGMPVQQPNPFSQPDQFEPAAFNRQNPYNQFQQPYGRRAQGVKRENHITFIFVTTLVFMIFFIIRSFTSLIYIYDLQYFKYYAQNAYIATFLYIVCTYIVCAAMILFFIFATGSRNTSKDIQKRVMSSEILFILSIMVLLLEIVYLGSEIYYIVIAGPEYPNFNVAFDIIFALIFHAPFIIFSIINVAKSSAFKRERYKNLKKRID